MDWVRQFLWAVGIILTLSSPTVSQDEGQEESGAVAFNNKNQHVDAFSTPTTQKSTTMPDLPPATTPVQLDRTTIPTVKVVPFIPTIPAIVTKNPTGNPLQTNPPTKYPGKGGEGEGKGDGDGDGDGDGENDITKDAKDGAPHIQHGGVLLVLSMTLGLLIRQWTSV